MHFGSKNTIQESLLLNAASVDKIVFLTEEYARKLKIKAASKKYAFLIDNVLDYWLNHGAEGNEIKLTLGRKKFRNTVTLEMEGEKLDPYEIKESDFGIGGKDILVSSGQLPEYDYSDNKNIVTLKLVREKSSLLTIVSVCVMALLVGILGNVFIPFEIRQSILDTAVGPVVNMFFNLLRCIAGPMVFLSVVWGICGIGDSRLFGKIGKSVFLFSFWVTALGAIVGSLVFFCFGNRFTSGVELGGNLNSLFIMILDIVPSSIVDPFSTGNTLQIIFMAIAVGIALITMSNKVGKLVVAVDQFNMVVQFLMEFISKLVPFIVFLLLVDIIWSDSLNLISHMWEFFIAIIGAFTVISLLMCAITAIKQKVNFFTVAKKNITSFIVALTTASSAAAFSSNMQAAKNRYGISEDLAGFSIPLGMIVHNPIAACYNIVLVSYFAKVYGVSCSAGWLITGIVVATVVAISSPPIPGGAAVSYALLFAQMGIPEEALALVLVLDVVTDFLVTAYECYVLPISMTNIAGKLKRLDRKILNKK